MLIDTHCHLSDKNFEGKVSKIMEEAIKAGVEKILVPTTGLRDLERAIEITNNYPEIYLMAGIHPEVLADDTNPESREEWLAADGEWLLKLGEMIKKNKKIVGIGEIGMDFHYDKDKISLKLQKEIFVNQMKLAIRNGLPVVIHMRDAEKEMREALEDMEELPRGQFHCWAGSEIFLDFVLKKGFYVSFCGNITYKSAGALREMIKKVPSDRLLLETDAPYLPPEGMRGSLNTPANVKIIASYQAKLLEVTEEDLINQTGNNVLCLYSAI